MSPSLASSSIEIQLLSSPLTLDIGLVESKRLTDPVRGASVEEEALTVMAIGLPIPNGDV
jgi:hypothetical protein